jgi:Protein of unknown function (DUF3072)
MSTPDEEIRPAGSDETAGTTQQTLGATDESGALERDPDQWVSGDDPMTPAQRSYLDTLAKEAGEEIPADLTKAAASQHIERLKAQLGR